MTQAGSSDGRQTIARASDEAIIALAQTTFAAFALRASDGCISTTAAQVFCDPEAGVGTPNTEETPGQREARRKRIVAILESVKSHVQKMGNRQDLFDPRHLGGVVNKMVITHAVAVLEAFLDGAAEPFVPCMLPYLCTKKRRELARSFGGKCDDLRCGGVLDLRPVSGYQEAALLAQVRHVIVHRNGKVDGSFRTAAARSTSALAPPLQSLEKGEEVGIPIDEFILPAIQGAVRFVDAAAQALQGKVCP